MTKRYNNIDSELLNKATKRKSSLGTSEYYNVLKVGDDAAFALYQSVEESLLENQRVPECPLCSCSFSQAVILEHLEACAAYRRYLYSVPVPQQVKKAHNGKPVTGVNDVIELDGKAPSTTRVVSDKVIEKREKEAEMEQRLEENTTVEIDSDLETAVPPNEGKKEGDKTSEERQAEKGKKQEENDEEKEEEEKEKEKEKEADKDGDNEVDVEVIHAKKKSKKNPKIKEKKNRNI